MKKILLVGDYYSSNLGDNILCQCVEFLVKKTWKDASIEWLDLSHGDAPIVYRDVFFM